MNNITLKKLLPMDQNASTKQSVLVLLKTETAEIHRRVEDVLNIRDPALSRAEYREILISFYKIYRPLEYRFVQHALLLSPDFNLELRLKTHLIQTDLIDLGCTDTQLNTIEDSEAFVDVNSSQTLIGALYVVEGATLGGQLICRSLRQNLNLGNEAHRFFSGYGEKTGQMWKEFCRLATESTCPDDFAGVLLSAKLTFEAFYKQLSSRTAAS